MRGTKHQREMGGGGVRRQLAEHMLQIKSCNNNNNNTSNVRADNVDENKEIKNFCF